MWIVIAFCDLVKGTIKKRMLKQKQIMITKKINTRISIKNGIILFKFMTLEDLTFNNNFGLN